MVGPLASWRSLVLVLAIAAAVAYGLSVRLEDPLSSSVIPAEDPYTHMALVREHLDDGVLDPLNEGGSLYPPGMHAMMAAVIAYTGADLYDLTRVGPALFGALGLAGIAILLSRFESLGAALAAVLALAIMPEAIFRTTMMSPTAVDVALLPFFAFAILMTLQGRLAWAGPAAALAAFLLFSHPWLFGILGVSGLALILLITVLPWPTKYGSLIAPWGLVAVMAIVGSGVAFALTGCWGGCGPGFRDVLGSGSGDVMGLLGLVVLVISLLPLAIKAWRPGVFNSLLPPRRAATPFAARLLVSQAFLVSTVALVWAANSEGFPPLVDLVRMFGWPLLVLGGLGLVLLPFRPTPGGHIGAALALATFPFVIFNPFESPFWSHRTAVYFGIGLAILVGVFFVTLVSAAVALARRLPTGPATPAPAAGAPPLATTPGRITPLVAVSGLLLFVGLAGGVYAATPPQYEGGWYRLYSECEFDGLREVAGLVEDNPGLLVVAGAWQPRLVLAGLAEGADRMWYKPDFYTNPAERDNVIQLLEQQGRPILVLVDHHMATEHPEIDASFLEESPWTLHDAWCPDAAPGDSASAGSSTLRAYTLE